jgi:predicted permease
MKPLRRPWIRTIDDFGRDVRYALRYLRQAPLFTLTATVSIAMGVGANAGVFAVVEQTLLRPLPVANPHELVYVTDERILSQPSPRFSYPFYAALRENTVLDGVAARDLVAITATINGQTLRPIGELVSENYFTVIGVTAQNGRTFSAVDVGSPVAVISDRFWRRVLAAEPSVVGRELTLNDRTFTVVGVTPEGFAGTDVGNPVDVWIPLTAQQLVGRDLMEEARTNWLEMIGRLNSGMTAERAADELTRELQRRLPDLPTTRVDQRVLLVPGEKGQSAVRAELGPALAILMTLAMLALSLACVNVGGLFAVRAAGREKEVAVRLALGVGRSRLVRQFLTEGLVLAALGGAAGLLLAPWVARLLVASQPHSLAVDSSLDLRVVIYASAATALVGLVVALAPIVASRTVMLATVLESRSAIFGTTARRSNAHDLVVALQIAMALTMLISAALLVQSLRNFNSVNPGFRANHLLLASLDPASAGYGGDRLETFWRQTLTRVSQLDGVHSASLARTIPLAPGRQRQHWHNPNSGRQLELDTNFVGPRYFQTLEIPLLSGRDFEEHDGKTSRPVVIVNERFARMFWPNQDPIGKGIRLPDSGDAMAEVVGVVRDVKYRDLRAEAGPMIYRPVFQTRSSDSLSLHVRLAGDPMTLVGPIRSEIERIDRNVPLFQVTTLEEHLNGSFAQTRQAALLTGVFGVIALVLSGIGVYGVTALAVSRRTRDIGIRIALGARGPDIARAIGMRGAAILAVGLVLGLAGSLGVTQTTGTLLFGVTARDSATFFGMTALLALVSLIAFSIPLRAATRLDPVAAVRHD